MRRFDKTKNMLKANILAEQRYMESKGLIKEYSDIEIGADKYDEMKNLNTDFEANLENLDIYFTVKGQHQAVAKVLDIKIPNSNNELVPITYVFDIEYARDSIGADADEDPAMGGTDSEIDLKFNEEKSLLNDEARKYITYIDEKIVEKKDDYFDMINGMYN